MTVTTTYLGEKGYSIYKEEMTVNEQQFMRDELTVRPYVPGSPAKLEAFPIYRESPKKFYLPRFFGKDTYGVPNEVKIDTGEDININFQGDLRDYQINIVNTYMEHVKGEEGGGLLEIPCGRGKTIMALNIIAKLKKKTLVIVHKGFLLNQWIERIQTFLPDAKVGKIQGPVVDIEGKDIVIGMLQSLSMKEYPKGMFSCFGLTICDECHHIAAEVFVRSLLNIVTPYTLGLSATMQRKDGLTKVFKMFLGDIVYTEKRDKTDNVEVRAINYNNNDEEFSEIKYDYRGNPQYSTMITKLCNFNHRSEFIIKVLSDLLEENSNQQIMIIAHNKALLTYLYDAIEHRHIAPVGYYVGGMKEKHLKESEVKKVILATYAMAAEALDIKTLSTLIMATPKTDVTQAVGRILRTKDHKPLVVDIVDQHDLFKKQWNKRRLFYAKQDYKIISIDSDNYENKEWKTIYEPGSKKSKKTKEPLADSGLIGKCIIKL